MRLAAAFASILEARFDEGSVTPDGWSAKDVMIHVGFWAADCADVLDRIGAGTWDGRDDETPGSIQATNREGFERSRGMASAEIRSALEDGRRRMVSAFAGLEAVTSEAWEWFEESGPLHYASHLRDLS